MRFYARRLIVSITLAIVVAASIESVRAEEGSGWKAGIAKTVITPQRPMWMSGYSSRDHAAEGKLHDLWAKALVLEDPAGKHAVLVTLDLVGIDRQFSLNVRQELEKLHGLTESQIAINCSHTHTGPIVARNLRAMYFLDAEQTRLVDDYADTLHRNIVAVVGEAIKNLGAAKLSWGGGEASFAVNRRTNSEPEVPELAAAGKLRGPVDHDVPVLTVMSAAGSLQAIVFGYACHATALSFYQWSGDWPGFAQIDLEREHPGAVAMSLGRLRRRIRTHCRAAPSNWLRSMADKWPMP